MTSDFYFTVTSWFPGNLFKAQWGAGGKWPNLPFWFRRPCGALNRTKENITTITNSHLIFFMDVKKKYTTEIFKSFWTLLLAKFFSDAITKFASNLCISFRSKLGYNLHFWKKTNHVFEREANKFLLILLFSKNRKK